jgi:tRNA(fMet)-specific endonuclease VapC
MIHLLDTDLFIVLMRGGKKSARRRQRQQAMLLESCCRKTQAAGDTVGLSAITVSELEFEAQASGRHEEEMTAIRKVLTPFKLYDYDVTVCPRHYARIRHELDSSGRMIGALDTLIAAHAMALSAVLVTNNEAHFGRVPSLTVVNWLTMKST